MSLFIEPDAEAIEAARGSAPRSSSCTPAPIARRVAEDDAARAAARARAARAGPRGMAQALGLEVHAGHGLDFDTVRPVAAHPGVVELNIGHFLIGEAIFVGLDAAVRAHARADGRGRRAASGGGGT